MACIHKRVFYDICSNYPDILVKMKKKALQYNDPWKQFKVTVLKQIDYFGEMVRTDEFYNEAQFHLSEENYEAGSLLVACGDTSKDI